MKLAFLIGILLLSSFAVAAIPAKSKDALRHSAILRGSGAIHGGLAGKGFSLLDVKTVVAKTNKLERMTVAYGDPRFQPHRGAPGYFHIENSIDSKRVVINFRQTLTAKFDEKVLQRAFSKSPFVKSSQMMFDPETQSLSFVLTMKKAVSVRAIPMPGKKSQMAQLQIDFFEDSLLPKPTKAGAVTNAAQVIPASANAATAAKAAKGKK